MILSRGRLCLFLLVAAFAYSRSLSQTDQTSFEKASLDVETAAAKASLAAQSDALAEQISKSILAGRMN